MASSESSRRDPRIAAWLLAVTGAALVVWISWRLLAAATSVPEPRVLVGDARIAPIEQLVVASGLVTYSDTAALSGPIGAGRMKRLLVATGDVVDAGQPVMEFEAPRGDGVVVRLLRALERAKATLGRRTAGDTPDPADVEMAQLDVASAEQDLQDAQRALDQMIVRAPFKSVIIQTPDSFGVGSTQPMVVVARPDSLVIDVEIDESDARQVAAGSRARVTFPPAATVFTGHVTAPPRLRRMRPQGALFAVSIAFDAAKPPVTLGMGASVRIVAAREDAALVVPRSALISRENRWFVMVRHDETNELRAVKIGLENDEVTEILSGLAAGASVVLYPLGSKAAPGQ